MIANLIKGTVSVEIKWGKQTSLQVNGDVAFDTSAVISRYLARIASSHCLYGSTVLERTEVKTIVLITNYLCVYNRTLNIPVL